MATNISIIESDSKGILTSTPFFSIGVTTYNRPELLKQTLVSIITQTFANFEIIVGNDYIQEPLSADLLDIRDSRIRFVNHPQNLGEALNMNTLLDLSQGRYFTWQCDDDLYAPNFLEEVHSALIRFDYPHCVFTSYELIYDTSFPDMKKTLSGKEQILSGRQFLRSYWSGNLKAMGCTGVYDKEYLKRIGGVECLTGTSTPLYSEHLLKQNKLYHFCKYKSKPVTIDERDICTENYCSKKPYNSACPMVTLKFGNSP